MNSVQGGLLQSSMFCWVTMNSLQINLFIWFVCSRTLHIMKLNSLQGLLALKSKYLKCHLQKWLEYIQYLKVTLTVIHSGACLKQLTTGNLFHLHRLITVNCKKSLTLYTTHYHSVFDVKCYSWHNFSLLYQLQIYCYMWQIWSLYLYLDT